jgi:hypothetical protein
MKTRKKSKRCHKADTAAGSAASEGEEVMAATEENNDTLKARSRVLAAFAIVACVILVTVAIEGAPIWLGASLFIVAVAARIFVAWNQRTAGNEKQP